MLGAFFMVFYATSGQGGDLRDALVATLVGWDAALTTSTLTPPATLDEPALAGCYSAAAQGISVAGDRAGKPLLRLLLPQEPPARPRASDITDQPIAEVRGINIHAAQVVDGRDRLRVERLAKYITRPPVAQDRLAWRVDGRLELSFKKPWRDGTRALFSSPTT
ncbi:MAG TPA: transposase [Polyangiaceae bacterium]|nr:transposase [Polyangiaceae bacterium]